MVRRLSLAAAMLLAIGATQVDAGVQDSIFEGTVFRIPQFGDQEGRGFQALDISADFGPDFSLFREELDGDARFGTYEEDDSGFVSSWTVDYVLNSDVEAS